MRIDIHFTARGKHRANLHLSLDGQYLYAVQVGPDIKIDKAAFCMLGDHKRFATEQPGHFLSQCIGVPSLGIYQHHKGCVRDLSRLHHRFCHSKHRQIVRQCLIQPHNQFFIGRAVVLQFDVDALALARHAKGQRQSKGQKRPRIKALCIPQWNLSPVNGARHTACQVQVGDKPCGADLLKPNSNGPHSRFLP